MVAPSDLLCLTTRFNRKLLSRRLPHL
uniref:Uncharacterized protein n=1 Tax=Rhizophora mucronata TaxID=61149 RepID=A0A2P2NLL9_RHIMU